MHSARMFTGNHTNSMNICRYDDSILWRRASQQWTDLLLFCGPASSDSQRAAYNSEKLVVKAFDASRQSSVTL